MTATRDDWLEAYSTAYDAPPGPIDLPCPNCGHRTLRLVFTGDRDQMVGYAHFWCDHCGTGIGISRTEIPDGAVIRDIHQPRDQRRPPIPDYQLVQ
jgi:hypothetical protein